MGIMKQLLLTMFIGMVASTAQAGCFADYKAKQDNPLRLHYGLMQLNGPCNRGAATSEVADRLMQAGWTLLNVQSVFGPEGLSERKTDAGSYFLRF